jgi:hypothetical protein
MRGVGRRSAFQTGKQPDRRYGRFAGRLQEWQGPEVANLAGMTLSPVQFVGGSERRGLSEDHGTEHEQRERRSQSSVCYTGH